MFWVTSVVFLPFFFSTLFYFLFSVFCFLPHDWPTVRTSTGLAGVVVVVVVRLAGCQWWRSFILSRSFISCPFPFIFGTFIFGTFHFHFHFRFPVLVFRVPVLSLSLSLSFFFFLIGPSLRGRRRRSKLVLDLRRLEGLCAAIVGLSKSHSSNFTSSPGSPVRHHPPTLA